ncbi:hypothetical protein P5673_017787 [Acropora cervicornis]|uniref:Uncharacterized protein n=1 Tax=Acropora cervicornis TaxID=6130 RepID=A0AAD9V3B3_ACRCE|nr:hypothetical protein P5673_017787 [Acropora cervicornis]
MMSIYTRVKSYALRTGPYLYDMRFLLAGFAITYLGVSKIAAAGAKKPVTGKGVHKAIFVVNFLARCDNFSLNPQLELRDQHCFGNRSLIFSL